MTRSNKTIHEKEVNPMFARLVSAGGIVPHTRNCINTGHTPISGDCLGGNVPNVGMCIRGKPD